MEHNFIYYFNQYYTLKILGDTENVESWKPKGLSAVKHPARNTSDNSLSPSIKWYRNSNFCLFLKGSCLKQKHTHTHTQTNGRVCLHLWLLLIY